MRGVTSHLRLHECYVAGGIGQMLFDFSHAFGAGGDQLFGAVHAFGVDGNQFACFGDFLAGFPDRLQCSAGEPFRLILPLGDLGEKFLYLIQAVRVILGGRSWGILL